MGVRIDKINFHLNGRPLCAFVPLWLILFFTTTCPDLSGEAQKHRGKTDRFNVFSKCRGVLEKEVKTNMTLWIKREQANGILYLPGGVFRRKPPRRSGRSNCSARCWHVLSPIRTSRDACGRRLKNASTDRGSSYF